MRRVLAIVLLIAAGAGAFASRERLERPADHDAERQLLYLPNGRQLKMMSLGHASLLADWLYIWAIQYYSEYERADRYRYVEHVFGDVIAELDPHYVDAYWLGALIMIVEAKDLDAGLRLLDKGFDNNPEQWILPYLGGWECFHAGQFERAERYFRRAAAAPGAPPQVERIRAATLARTGDVSQALRLWNELLEDPQSDAATRAIAERKVREIRVRLDLQALDGAVARFAAQAGRRPSGWTELVAAGILRAIPVDPDGAPYEYDPQTGQVSSPAARLLSGN